MTDSLSDLLTRIKNGYMAGKKEVICRLSKLNLAVSRILETCGFVEKVSVEKYTIKIVLKYKNKKPAVESLKRISKPGLRVYVKHNEIKKPFGGLGISIISTPGGIMTGIDAKKKKLGGEFLCEVW